MLPALGWQDRGVSEHAFVDESVRGDRYLLTAVVVVPGDLRRLRVAMRGLLLPGQRELHFQKEKPRRRRWLLDQVVAAGVEATVYAARSGRHGQEAARQACLTQLAKDLIVSGAHRLVIDSRDERDRFDVGTLQTALGPHPSRTRLVYEHELSQCEPLIWAADMTGWAHGAGGDWRLRIDSAIRGVVDCGRVSDSAKPGRRPSGR